ncbi:MAG: ABC transporter permease [Gemmataceae bacterium]|nr:ABC transporter permease [Gemmataceae bacterium]
MQFLAFLGDSYREARSGWMLQLMLVLSALLVLLVASIGFRPITVQDQLDQPLKLMTRLMAANPEGYAQLGKPTFAVENLSATDPNTPWRSDYAFDFVVATPSAEDMRKARQAGGLPTTGAKVREFLRQALEDYERVEVEDPPPPPAAGAFLAAGGPAVLGGSPPWATAEERYRVAARGNKVDDPLAWPHQVSVLFAWDVPFMHVPTRTGAYYIEKWLVSEAGAWVALLVSVIITAGFVPNMLAKGSLDLLVSKPIGRSRLLIYKYVGGLTFVFLLAAFTGAGVWLAVGLRTGLWTPHFLALIPILTFYFAVLYSVSTLAGVLTRSTLFAILATGLAWGLFWVVGKANDGVQNLKAVEADMRAKMPTAPVDPDGPMWGFVPRWLFAPITAVHAVTPRTYELDSRLGRVIAEGVLTPYQLGKQGYDKPPREDWAEMLGVSAAFVVLMLGLACWRFETRDH